MYLVAHSNSRCVDDVSLAAAQDSTGNKCQVFLTTYHKKTIPNKSSTKSKNEVIANFCVSSWPETESDQSLGCYL